MPTQYAELIKRSANSTAEVRCDRRTICTLTQYFSKQYPLASISQVIRLAMEEFEEAILDESPEYAVDSVEDADEVLSVLLGKVSLNRGGRNDSVLKRHLEKESAFLEGRDIRSANARRVTKSMQTSAQRDMKEFLKGMTPEKAMKILREYYPETQNLERYKPRMPENVVEVEVETLEQAQKRREDEIEEMKKQLSKPKV